MTTKSPRLSQIEAQLARKKYGKNAQPKLFPKKDVESLIEQNMEHKTKLKMKLTAWNILRDKIRTLEL